MFATYIVPLSILIPIIFGILNIKKANAAQRLLFSYLLSSGLINLAAIILVKLKFRNNLPLLHLYTIIEAVLILYYFRKLFIDELTHKILGYIIILFPLICIINFTFIQSIFTFNSYTRPLEAILITFFCMLYMYKNETNENWFQKPESWFNMGILIYFPVACIIFILSNYMVFVGKNKQMNSMIWDINAALSMLMYLIWARGFSLIKNDR